MTVLVVCSSDYYVQEYYLKLQRLAGARYTLMENKLDPARLPARDSVRRRRTDDTLTIGYFGLLRCPTSWDFLRRLAEEGEGRVRVVAAGLPTGIDTIERDVAESPFLEYLGPYVSPDALPDLYGRGDLVWALDPYGVPNGRWARTNRYYEAGYFRRPMIVQRGTPDGFEVERADVGLAIDLGSPDEAVRGILGVTQARLGEWEGNLDEIDVATFTMTDDYERVIDELIDAEGTCLRLRSC